MKKITNFLNEASTYHKMGFNLIPTGQNKRPLIPWGKLTKTRQLKSEVINMPWSGALGIGFINGINLMRTIDLDNIKNINVVKKILKILDLPEDYKWIVKTKRGYHIHIKASDEILMVNNSNSGVHRFKLKGLANGFLELRSHNCQTLLPPSNYSDNKRYKFLHGEPKRSPSRVSWEKIHEMLKEMTDIERLTQSENIDSMNREAVSEDELRKIEIVSNFLKGRINNYTDWISIGFALASIGEAGRKFFITISDNENYPEDTPQSLNRKFNKMLKDYDPQRGNKITIGSLFFIANEKYGFDYSTLDLNENEE